MHYVARLNRSHLARCATPHCVLGYVLVTAAYNEEANIEKTIRVGAVADSVAEPLGDRQ